MFSLFQEVSSIGLLDSANSMELLLNTAFFERGTYLLDN